VAKSWTDGAPAPVALQEHAHLKDPLRYKIKRAFLGAPINRHHLSHERLKKRYALGILASDCISSSAYGSEQILLVLIPAFGMMAFQTLIPMTVVILTILVLLTLSYNNVISKYTQSGGAYIVARENLGRRWSVVAAVSLILDYVVTVAVQTSAGVIAITSYFQSLAKYQVLICVLVIAFLTFGNLRGVKEAGRAFAMPTYLFVIATFVIFGIGIYKQATGNLAPQSTHEAGMIEFGSHSGLLTFASIFILLRAFANGGSSLTGLEAISNGVSLFKAPEGRNARITMNIMAGLLGTLVFGVSWFAHVLHTTPYDSGTPSVISEISRDILGSGTFGNIWFAFMQLATALILLAGANTVYNALPILSANLALDGFLPRQLSKRGHKLAFSNGILICSALAISLIVFSGGSLNALVALYAIGVFTAFTITAYGIAKNSMESKEPRWVIKSIVSYTAALTSFFVVIIFSFVKFEEGAWIILVAGPLLMISMIRTSERYKKEQEILKVRESSERATSIARHDVSILVDSVDIATISAVRYARSLKPHKIKAVHFVIDDKRAEEIQEAWTNSDAVNDIQLDLIDCPDRRIANAAVDYAIRKTEKPDIELTLLLPRRSYSRFLGRLLHDQTAEEIAAPISQLKRVVATIIPFDVNNFLANDSVTIHDHDHDENKSATVVPNVPAQATRADMPFTPISHYAEHITPIGRIEWRKRAHVQGRVTSVSTAPRGSAPTLQVEVWDETGGITLNFLGRREIAGLEVGMEIRAEGMVGEEDGTLVILNPSYELVIQ
jgi:amino acid transporter